MFTQRCFIRKNTKELRDRLTLIGYRYGGIDEGYEQESIYCNHGELFEVDKRPARDFKIIDCGENEDLFLAIAALRDDSDIHQYFILDYNISCASENFKPKGTFILCNRNTWFRDFNKDGNVDMFSSANIPAHKATLEELIEHFK